MKVLELFKGTGSITNFYKNNKSVEVISLDILKKYTNLMFNQNKWECECG